MKIKASAGMALVVLFLGAAVAERPLRQQISWGALQIDAPKQVYPGTPFTLRFRGRGAGHVRVRFTTESGITLIPTAVSAVGSLVLGRVAITEKEPNHLTVQLLSKYDQRDIVIPLKHPSKPVQELGFSEAYFRNLNAHRKTEDMALAKVYASITPKAWNKPFALPTNGKPTSPFGTPRRYAPGTPVAFHLGSDFGSPLGTSVFSVNDGRVVGIFHYTVRGNMTVIDHGLGLFSAYFHQSSVGVHVGQYVKRGQYIGAVGSTGLSTAPHLHLEFRLRGEAVSPLPWLGQIWPDCGLSENKC